jgi:hypothetical protein
VDVIDFVENGVLAESSHRLTPVQRFVLKMSYGLPLDADTKTIFANQTVMTETEYVAFLHDEGRCNVAEGGHQFAQVAVAKGRRSGGTFLTAAMMACEVYDLLSSHECPQAHFGMSDTSVIGVMGVSHDKNQASALGEEAARNIARVPWFHRHAAKVSSTGRTFQTSHDIKTTGTWAADSDAVATVSLLFRSANVKSLKGHACKTVFLDEMAFYREEDSTYQALLPTTLAFGSAGRFVMLSSTNGKRGRFYKTFKSAAEGRAGTLTLQIPTWEFNPLVDRDRLEQFRQEYGEARFQAEYGAQFIDFPREA